MTKRKSVTHVEASEKERERERERQMEKYIDIIRRNRWNRDDGGTMRDERRAAISLALMRAIQLPQCTSNVISLCRAARARARVDAESSVRRCCDLRSVNVK